MEWGKVYINYGNGPTVVQLNLFLEYKEDIDYAYAGCAGLGPFMNIIRDDLKNTDVWQDFTHPDNKRFTHSYLHNRYLFYKILENVERNYSHRYDSEKVILRLENGDRCDIFWYKMLLIFIFHLDKTLIFDMLVIEGEDTTMMSFEYTRDMYRKTSVHKECVRNRVFDRQNFSFHAPGIAPVICAPNGRRSNTPVWDHCYLVKNMKYDDFIKYMTTDSVVYRPFCTLCGKYMFTMNFLCNKKRRIYMPSPFTSEVRDLGCSPISWEALSDDDNLSDSLLRDF